MFARASLLVLLVSYALVANPASAQTLLAGWTFESNANPPLSVSPANLGQYGGNLYSEGSFGSSAWAASELNAFAGSPVGDPRSSTIASFTYSLVNNSANGKYITLRTSTTSYEGISLQYTTIRTATGFTSQQWSYSTDGVNFTDFGSAHSPTTSFAPHTLNLSSVPALNDQAHVYLRVQVSGASAATGNNRLDNIRIQSTNYTWYGATNNSFINNLNWRGPGLGIPNAPGVNAGVNINFQGTPNHTPDFNFNGTVGRITFNAGTSPLTIFGTNGLFELTINGGVRQRSTNTQTFSTDLRLGANQTWNTEAGNLVALGRLRLGSGTNGYVLTIDGPNNTSLSGLIQDGGSAAGSIVKQGTGILTLSGNNTFSGGVTVHAGTLRVSNSAGSATGTGAVILQGGRLEGGNASGTTGFIGGNLTVNGGTLAPGTSTGILHLGGSLTLSATATVEIELNGPLAGTEHDQIIVAGPVTLGGATLNATLGFTPAVDDQLFILINNSSDPISGTFAGLADGAAINFGTTTGYISYFGDASANTLTGGNDIVIYFSAIPEPTTWTLLGLGLAGAAGTWRWFRRGRQVETDSSALEDQSVEDDVA